MIGCDCAVCHSSDQRDRRLRSSVVIRSDDTTILIDTTPDLRAQSLRANLRHLDAVLFTHAHADHTAGLDELRSFNAIQNEHIPVWATRETGDELQSRFAYAFVDTFPSYGLKPDLTLNEIDGPFQINELTVTPIPIMHGRLPILGFRIGDIAYLTDLKSYPDASAGLLQDLDVLVITALRQDPHPAHLALSEALLQIEEIAPKRAWLTHISHSFGFYEAVAPTLPKHVRIAIDGELIEMTEKCRE